MTVLLNINILLDFLQRRPGFMKPAAELFAAIFLVTYLCLAVPPIAAGFAVPLTGFLGTTQAYLGAVLIVSATATVLQWLPSRSRGAPA